MSCIYWWKRPHTHSDAVNHWSESLDCEWSRAEMGTKLRAVLYMWSCCLSPVCVWVSDSAALL